MPTTLNVNEAKTHFSGLITEVEKSLVSFTIMRYGRPVARIVPLDTPRRSFKPIPGIAGKIKVKCDLHFPDGSGVPCGHARCRHSLCQSDLGMGDFSQVARWGN